MTGLPADLVEEIVTALEGDSNDAEHDALVAVAQHFGIDPEPAPAPRMVMEFRFRVVGRTTPRTFLGGDVNTFDETYDVEGEHPAEAIEKLMGEIEWGILDGDKPFTIEFLAWRRAGEGDAVPGS